MRLQLSWIAVKDGSMDEVLERLGLEVIGETMWEVEEEFAIARTDHGWSVVVMKDWPDKPDEAVAAAAPAGSALYVAMTEIAMFSELRAYEDGRMTWSVTRDCEKEGVLVQGSPPTSFADIRRRLEAEQAASGSSQTDYLFDLPQDLSARLCGYKPATGTLNWQVLGKKKRPSHKLPASSPRSLTAAIKSDLLPLLWSLGWRPANDAPKLSVGGEIIRDVGEQKQTIWFEYASAPDTYIDVFFQWNEPLAAGSTKVETGRTGQAFVRIPWWKRLSWSRFWALTRAAPPSGDLIGVAIEKAKADILAIDDYLKKGKSGPPIQTWVREHPASP